MTTTTAGGRKACSKKSILTQSENINGYSYSLETSNVETVTEMATTTNENVVSYVVVGVPDGKGYAAGVLEFL